MGSLAYHKGRRVLGGFNGLEPRFNAALHRYREEGRGTWTHKPGFTPVQTTTNPTADSRSRGYTIDCGNLCVPKRGLNVD